MRSSTGRVSVKNKSNPSYIIVLKPIYRLIKLVVMGRPGGRSGVSIMEDDQACAIVDRNGKLRLRNP